MTSHFYRLWGQGVLYHSGNPDTSNENRLKNTEMLFVVDATKKYGNDFRKCQVRLSEINFLDDFPLIWLTAVSGICKQCIVSTVNFIDFLLIIYSCKQTKQFKIHIRSCVRCANNTPTYSSVTKNPPLGVGRALCKEEKCTRYSVLFIHSGMSG